MMILILMVLALKKVRNFFFLIFLIASFFTYAQFNISQQQVRLKGCELGFCWMQKSSFADNHQTENQVLCSHLSKEKTNFQPLNDKGSSLISDYSYKKIFVVDENKLQNLGEIAQQEFSISWQNFCNSGAVYQYQLYKNEYFTINCTIEKMSPTSVIAGDFCCLTSNIWSC